ncbi:hypothetical protein EAS68_13045 [Legionella jordanis]|nr:hypothetical protein EAS68_13045 [Legionella jordanis]
MRCYVRKELILQQLLKIQQLKSEISKRIWKHSQPVCEIDKDKFNGKGEALTKDVIKARVERLAEQLIKEHPNSNPVLISLMDGALPFANLLQHALNERGYQYTYTTMQASSYGNHTVSGELKIGSMPKVHLGGRTVFVVDDVCETGKTYLKIRELFNNMGAKQVSLVVLVDKVQQRTANYSPEYVGFEIPSDAFIVGMGLDYYGELRNELEIRGVDPAFSANEEEQKLLESEEALNKELVQIIAAEKLPKLSGSDHTFIGNMTTKDSSHLITEHKPVAEMFSLN